VKLWPFAKKPEEVEALSPGCDLPAGVMLASPEDHDLVVEPQPPRGNRDASTTVDVGYGRTKHLQPEFRDFRR
jgi:hypothetical protein